MNHRVVLPLIHYSNEHVLESSFHKTEFSPYFEIQKQHFVPKIEIISFAVTKILCHFGFISETS